MGASSCHSCLRTHQGPLSKDTNSRMYSENSTDDVTVIKASAARQANTAGSGGGGGWGAVRTGTSRAWDSKQRVMRTGAPQHNCGTNAVCVLSVLCVLCVLCVRTKIAAVSAAAGAATGAVAAVLPVCVCAMHHGGGGFRGAKAAKAANHMSTMVRTR